MRERRAWDRNFSDIIRVEQFGAEVLADSAHEQWDRNFSDIISLGDQFGAEVLANSAQEQWDRNFSAIHQGASGWDRVLLNSGSCTRAAYRLSTSKLQHISFHFISYHGPEKKKRNF